MVAVELLVGRSEGVEGRSGLLGNENTSYDRSTANAGESPRIEVATMPEMREKVRDE
jgi:hypothetical protein